MYFSSDTDLELFNPDSGYAIDEPFDLSVKSKFIAKVFGIKLFFCSTQRSWTNERSCQKRKKYLVKNKSISNGMYNVKINDDIVCLRCKKLAIPKEVERECKICGEIKPLDDKNFRAWGLRFERVCRKCYAARKRVRG